MKTYESKTCSECGQAYLPSGPAAKFCPHCAEARRLQSARTRTQEYRRRQGRKVGVGKGGANASGQQDDQFQTGIRSFKRDRHQVKAEVRYCERCGKDLVDAGHGQWGIHHRDHNRRHNVRSNYELLCKRCHQLEHKCEENLPKVQRLSREGVGNSVPEAPATL